MAQKNSGVKYLNSRNYVTREQWGAKEPKSRKSMKTPIPYVVFTYAQTKHCDTKKQCVNSVYSLQACAMASCELGDIKANFLIGGDGRVYEGRGWKNAPEKYDGPFKNLAPLNRKCIEVSFISLTNIEPTKEQGEAAATLIREGIAQNILTDHVKVTTLYKDYTIPKAVRNLANVKVSRHVTKEQETLMTAGPMEYKAFIVLIILSLQFVIK